MSRTLIALFAATTLFAGACPALAGGARLEVFYLGAPDCPYCAHWASQSRAALLAIDGKVVLGAFGTGGYERDFVPALKQAVRRQREAK